MANNIDRRSYKTQMRSTVGTDGQRRIVGHAAIFNSMSEDILNFKEVILPGAFRDAIPRSDCRCLVNHDPSLILGRTKSGTLQIREDGIGLAIDCIPPDTQIAHDILESIKRSDIDQMSFSFTVDRDRWYTNGEGITIREIISIRQIYDVAPVTYAAYEATEVSARSQEAFKNYRQRNQHAVGSGGAGSRRSSSWHECNRRLQSLERQIREEKLQDLEREQRQYDRRCRGYLLSGR